MTLHRKIRVLVVDDSAVMRKAISEALEKDPELVVVGTAADPYDARDMILELRPDVLTLDIEMPRMDGLSFLRVLQKHHPLPVVIISALTSEGSAAAIRALEDGAVEVLAKPVGAWSGSRLCEELAYRVKGAAAARNLCRPTPAEAPPGYVPAQAAYHANQLIVIGASTGGTEALKHLFAALPNGLPGICIVQHIPAGFSAALAERLNSVSSIRVKEAVDGDEVRSGHALLAPGDLHMLVRSTAKSYQIELKNGPRVHYTRPAVDVLFGSAASACPPATVVAVLLTGMGRDGAEGMAKLKRARALNVAQDEQTSIVFGMPRAAIELGVVDDVLPLEQIPGAIVRAANLQSQFQNRSPNSSKLYASKNT